MSQYLAVLKKEIKKYDPENAEELIITQIPFQKMPQETCGLILEFKSLVVLRVTHCELISLENFPMLPCLTRLDVSHNKLEDSFENIKDLPMLEHLNVSFNAISKLCWLSPLKKFRGLKISIKGNPCLQEKNWLSQAKSLKLKVIDEEGDNAHFSEMEEEQVQEYEDDPFFQPYSEIRDSAIEVENQSIPTQAHPSPVVYQSSSQQQSSCASPIRSSQQSIQSRTPTQIRFKRARLKQMRKFNMQVVPQSASGSPIYFGQFWFNPIAIAEPADLMETYDNSAETIQTNQRNPLDFPIPIADEGQLDISGCSDVKPKTDEIMLLEEDPPSEEEILKMIRQEAKLAQGQDEQNDIPTQDIRDQ